MKQPSLSLRSLVDRLAEAQRRLDFTASPHQLLHIAEYVDWAAPAAQKIGLTKYGAPSEFLDKLVIPTCVLFKAECVSSIIGPVLDFGCGSGALGLTAAILRPESRVLLADRRQRVIDFVNLCIARNGLANAEARIVNLADSSVASEQSFNTILLRAFAPGDEALRAALPWLVSGGHIALWHRPPAPDGVHCGLRLLNTTSAGPEGLVLSVYQQD